MRSDVDSCGNYPPSFILAYLHVRKHIHEQHVCVTAYTVARVGTHHRRSEKETWDKEAVEYRLESSWYGREVAIKGQRFRIYGFGRDELSGRAFVRGRTSINEEVRVGLDHVRLCLQASWNSHVSVSTQASSHVGCSTSSARSASVAVAPASESCTTENSVLSSGNLWNHGGDAHHANNVSIAGTSSSPHQHYGYQSNACAAHTPVWFEDCNECVRGSSAQRPPACLSHVLIQGCKLITIRGSRMLESADAQV
jgi:hypothetical protein